MGKKLEAQSIVEMKVNSESSPDSIVYDEKEVHNYNRKASLLLIALFGLKYVKSNKIRIEGNRFFSQAALKIDGELLSDTDHINENFSAKLNRFIEITSLIYNAIILRESDKINAIIASQAARGESGDIKKFLKARMELKNDIISISFGGK